MHIEISLEDGLPIYRQIINQFKYQVASGRLRPGDELPPIRVLAEQLAVTPNTIVKAYEDLAGEGIVIKRHGAGTYVAPRPTRLARKEQRRILAQRTHALVVEALQLDFSLAEVVRLVRARHARLVRQPKVASPRSESHAG